MSQNNNPAISADQIEISRLRALRSFRILDTPEEGVFDHLVDLAHQIFEVPMVALTFTGADRIFFKSNIGLGREKDEPRAGSIFDSSLDADIRVINDISDSPIFASHRYITGDMSVKFFASVPLITQEGYRIGQLSLMHHRAIPFNDKNQDILSALGRSVMDQLEQRRLLLEGRDWDSEKKTIIIDPSQGEETQPQHPTWAEENSIQKPAFGNLFDQQFIAVGLISADNHIKAANSSLREILEFNEPVIGEDIRALLPELEGKQFLELLENVKITREAFQLNGTELRIFHEDTLKTIFVDLSLQPITENGSDDILVVIKDVTDFTLDQRRLKDSMDTFTAAIEAGGFGYTVVKFATGKMESNGQLKKNYGFATDEDFDYPDLFDAMLPKHRQRIKELVQQAIETKGIYHAEYEVKWRDGSIHWISAHGKPRYDKYGRASHIVGLNREIKK